MTKVSDLFEVRYGHSLELLRLKRVSRGTGVAFVSRQMGDNGISAWVDIVPGVEPACPGELSCALGGNGVLTTHLQELPFYTGRDVARLIPLQPLSRAVLLFYSLCIRSNRYRFSYGRQANRTLRDLVIPSIDEVPEYVTTTNIDQFLGQAVPASTESVGALDVAGWKPFILGKIFDIRKGRRLTKAQLTPGSTPFISALDNNNGLRQRVGVEPVHPAGIITVNYNGNGVAEAFYQPEPFFASDDVNVLYPNFELDPGTALFVCSIIRREKFRFSYGRKWTLERMRGATICLPVTAAGSLDTRYMAQYIATLPFAKAALSDSIEVVTNIAPSVGGEQLVTG